MKSKVNMLNYFAQRLDQALIDNNDEANINMQDYNPYSNIIYN